MEATQYLVIGSGIAGVTAARTLVENDPKARVRLVSEEPHPCYYRPKLASYVLGRVREEDLWSGSEASLPPERVQILRGVRVVRVIPERNRVQLADGRTPGYGALLIASGARPEIPEFLLPNREHIVTLWGVDDARRIRERIDEGAKKAVVMGGGITGIELVRTLRMRGLDVLYLPAEGTYAHELLFTKPGDELAAVMRDKGVEQGLDGERIRKIVVEGGRLKGVKTTANRAFDCDIAGVSLSYAPDTSFLKGSGIEYHRGIVVDRNLRTNISNVFAAGDVAQAYSTAFRNYLTSFGWEVAAEQGRVAALNMAGKSAEYDLGEKANLGQIFGDDLVARWY